MKRGPLDKSANHVNHVNRYRFVLGTHFSLIQIQRVQFSWRLSNNIPNKKFPEKDKYSSMGQHTYTCVLICNIQLKFKGYFTEKKYRQIY